MISYQIKHRLHHTWGIIAGHAQHNWHELHRLAAREDHPSEQLVQAFSRYFEQDISPNAYAQLASIESLRTQLSTSKQQIEQIDFGASSPDASLTEVEMQQGTPVLKTVARPTASSKRPHSARLLYHLVRSFTPQHAIELGTNVGISAAYQATALTENGRGILITLEGSPAIAELACADLSRLGLTNVIVEVGRFADTLDRVLQTYRPADYLFIDGHHDEQATLAYFEQAHPYLSTHALLIFDDINWSSGMRRAWSTLQADPRLRITMTVQGMGVGIVGEAHLPKQDYTLYLV